MNLEDYRAKEIARLSAKLGVPPGVEGKTAIRRCLDVERDDVARVCRGGGDRATTPISLQGLVVDRGPELNRLILLETDVLVFESTWDGLPASGIFEIRALEALPWGGGLLAMSKRRLHGPAVLHAASGVPGVVLVGTVEPSVISAMTAAGFKFRDARQFCQIQVAARATYLNEVGNHTHGLGNGLEHSPLRGLRPAAVPGVFAYSPLAFLPVCASGLRASHEEFLRAVAWMHLEIESYQTRGGLDLGLCRLASALPIVSISGWHELPRAWELVRALIFMAGSRRREVIEERFNRELSSIAARPPDSHALAIKELNRLHAEWLAARVDDECEWLTAAIHREFSQAPGPDLVGAARARAGSRPPPTG